MTFKILVVDDETNIRNGLAKSLELEGYQVYMAENGNEALKEMLKKSIDLVISDLKMPGMSGDELMKKIINAYPTVPVILLTGHGSVETAVNSMRNGAFDFLTKPVNLDRLNVLVKRALANRKLIIQHQEIKKEVERLEKRRSQAMIGRSGAIQRVMELVDQVAQAKVSVLITGESGVGKELVADAIHNRSSRKEKPFIKVHCAALSENLLESELFGHEKGSFTGASSQRKGRFELAHGGTIFLDEIGEINQSVQIKILRVLQEKTFERVGGENSITVDTRIVAATNRDLKAEVEKGNFREDLYYRLNVVNIDVPPLRERKDDIPLLASTFLEQFAKENEKTIEGIDNKASTLLYNHTWPGNIRELRNCMESAVVLCKKHILGPDDLPPSVHSNEEEGVIRIELGTSMAEAEKIIIRQTLKGYNNNKSRTAEILGIGRKTLHRKIHDYGLEEEFLNRNS